MDKQKVELPIGFLASLNQGLQEEQRFVQQIKVEAKRIDEELDYKYGKLLDSMIKTNFLTATVRTKNFGLLVACKSPRILSTLTKIFICKIQHPDVSDDLFQDTLCKGDAIRLPDERVEERFEILVS